jgi:hypothetical protein
LAEINPSMQATPLLAELMAQDVHPGAAFWKRPLVASRLIEYEAWTRVHRLRLAKRMGESLRALRGRVAFLEMAPAVLVRALEPFPVPVPAPVVRALPARTGRRARVRDVRPRAARGGPNAANR